MLRTIAVIYQHALSILGEAPAPFYCSQFMENCTPWVLWA